MAIGVTWAAAIGRYGGPDEPAHVLRAYAVAHGEERVVRDAGEQPIEQALRRADAAARTDAAPATRSGSTRCRSRPDLEQRPCGPALSGGVSTRTLDRELAHHDSWSDVDLQLRALLVPNRTCHPLVQLGQSAGSRSAARRSTRTEHSGSPTTFS